MAAPASHNGPLYGQAAGGARGAESRPRQKSCDRGRGRRARPTVVVVDLDAGGRLVALQQNLQTSSMDVLKLRDARVRLAWRPEHEFAITGPM